jgi:hypothetical protein
MDSTALVVKSGTHSRLHGLHLHPGTHPFNNHPFQKDLFRNDLEKLQINKTGLTNNCNNHLISNRPIHQGLFRIDLEKSQIFRTDLINFSKDKDHSGRIQEVPDVPIHLGGKARNRVAVVLGSGHWIRTFGTLGLLG